MVTLNCQEKFILTVINFTKIIKSIVLYYSFPSWCLYFVLINYHHKRFPFVVSNTISELFFLNFFFFFWYWKLHGVWPPPPMLIQLKYHDLFFVIMSHVEGESYTIGEFHIRQIQKPNCWSYRLSKCGWKKFQKNWYLYLTISKCLDTNIFVSCRRHFNNHQNLLKKFNSRIENGAHRSEDETHILLQRQKHISIDANILVGIE